LPRRAGGGGNPTPGGGPGPPRREFATANTGALAVGWHDTCLYIVMLPEPSIYRRLLIMTCLAALSAHAEAQTGTGAPTDPQHRAFQDIAELEKLARTEAQRLLPPLTDTQRLVVGPLQPRLQLAACDTRVETARAPGIQAPGRVLIELRCNGHAPWHLFVPVKTVGTTSVVLAAHALIAGTVLTDKDLSVEQRDLIGLPPGYLNDPSIAIGMTAARGVAGGAILTNQQLLGIQAVQRGQTVTLIADAGGISVRMPGRALSDGLLNQRVRVENLSSGKIVEGIARSEQVVQIIF
jgi:flagellar basal body P-ring formation protein FlgA